jgi:hypothetical protein
MLRIYQLRGSAHFVASPMAAQHTFASVTINLSLLFLVFTAVMIFPAVFLFAS